MPDDNENPVEGKGEEMLPERGIPFGETSEDVKATASSGSLHEDPEMMSAVSLDEIAQWEEQLAEDFSSTAEKVPGVLSVEDEEPEDQEPAAGLKVSRELTEEEITAIEADTSPLGTPSLVSPEESAEYHTELIEDFVAESAPVMGVLSADEGESDEGIPAISREPVELSKEELASMMAETGEISQEVTSTSSVLEGGSAEEIPPESESVAEISEEEVAQALAKDEGDGEEGGPPQRFSEADMGLAQFEEPPTLEEAQDGGMSAGFVVPDQEIEALPPVTDEEPSIPPPEAMRGAPLFSEAALLAPGAIEGLEGSEAPELVGDLKTSRKMLKLLITEDRINALWDRADSIQKSILDHVDSVEIARQLLNQLRSAKTLLLSGEEQYEEAERAVSEVEYRIAYTSRSKNWAILANRLLIYELAWLVFLIIGAIFIPVLAGSLVDNIDVFGVIRLAGRDIPLRFPDFITAEDVFNSVGGMIWGGFGGVVGALYALWRHVSRDQDFNPQHNMWYITQPLMGVPIGAFIFLFIKLGFSFVAGNSDVQVASPFFIYLLAWIAGFQQNVVYDMVRQILKRLQIKGPEENASTSEEDAKA